MKDITLQTQFEKETGCASWINSDAYPDGKIYTKEYTEWLERKINRLLASAQGMDKEKLKEAFDAGYDYRSSLLPEVIKEFGENSASTFEEWYNCA